MYGHITAGFWDWARAALPTCTLVVHSSRSKTPEGIAAMQAWLGEQAAKDGAQDVVECLEYASQKPPAYLTIDDRAVCFQGDWSAPELSPEAIAAFKPWMMAPQAQAPDTQAAEVGRLQGIEDAARDVVISSMCGEPVDAGIEGLKRALGIECSPV